MKLSRRHALGMIVGATVSASRPLLPQIASPHPVPQVQPKSGTSIADFVDVAEIAGLTTRMIIGGIRQKRYILETTGAGVALFDYDNDGWLDIFLVNGASLDKSTHFSSKTSSIKTIATAPSPTSPQMPDSCVMDGVRECASVTTTETDTSIFS